MRKHQADRAMLMRSGYAVPAAAVLTKPLPMRNAQTPISSLWQPFNSKKYSATQLYGGFYNTQKYSACRQEKLFHKRHATKTDLALK